MISVKLTPEQFDAKCVQLAQQGITLSGSTGTISHNGVSVKYAYDGHNLIADVTHKPFFISQAVAEDKLKEWLSAE